MAKFKKTTVRPIIALNGDRRRARKLAPIEAVAPIGCDAFAVHRALVPTADGAETLAPTGDGWRVTHRRSGHSVAGTFDTRREALAAAAGCDGLPGLDRVGPRGGVRGTRAQRVALGRLLRGAAHYVRGIRSTDAGEYARTHPIRAARADAVLGRAPLSIGDAPGHSPGDAPGHSPGGVPVPSRAFDSVRDGERPLHAIAREIRADWRDPYFGAVPYLDAMHGLDTVRDAFGADGADSIVRYFLANAATWRGDCARRVKAELRAMLAA